MESAMSFNRMFKVAAVPLSTGTTCFNTITEDIGQLWHCRYGHLSFKGLYTLQQKEMVLGLPQLTKPSRVCKDCLLGKQHRDSFPEKSTRKAELPLQLIHSDFCGLIQPISNSNKKYFITFIDDCSRKTWVYFLNLQYSGSQKSKLNVKQDRQLKIYVQTVVARSHHQNS